MLSNVVEYFTMMASVYFRGSAARDPFTRQTIQEKQSDCYRWLVRELGSRSQPVSTLVDIRRLK
jgi:hypothetical protein